ncbi:MAG: sensor histidine kinase [Chitinophagaceae bacterium]|nr:MAG: sensor histidine kinase [Chitinophagaceae bacterium]
MARLFLLFVSSFLLPAIARCQKTGQPVVDSLLVELNKPLDDSSRVKTLEAISLEYIKTDHAKAMQYADEGIRLARKMNWKKGEIHLLVVRANALNEKGDKDGALEIYTRVLAAARELGDEYTLSITLNDIGGSFLRASDNLNATRYYTESLDLSLKIRNDNLIGTNYYNLSTVFYNQQDYKKSLDYAEKSLQYILKTNNADKIARSYNGLANVYMATGETDKAKANYERAMEMYKKSGNRTGLAIIYSQYAILFDPDYASIIHYQKLSQQIWDEVNPTHYNSIINLGNTGETYLNLIRADTLSRLTGSQEKALYDSARASLDRCLQYCRATSDMENLAYFSMLYSDMLAMQGNYKDALDKYKTGTAINDSLYSQANKNAIAGLESKREIGLRDKQIEINQLALSSERKQRIGLITGIALLLVIVALILRQSRVRKKTNTVLIRLNDQLDEANKVKAKFFAILSHDLRSPISNLVSFLELQEDAPDLLGPEQAKRQQQQIGSSARSLLETMESMLLWSKGQMEQFRPSIRPVKVASLYQHVEKLFANSGTTIIFDDPGNLEVNTDENYLQTIMHNLTANAVKALGRQSDGLIRWSAIKEQGETVLSITDNGPGLRDEQVSALYDDTVVANEKTGLGLHLVCDLASAIQCRIAVRSQLQSGTTFTLSI